MKSLPYTTSTFLGKFAPLLSPDMSWTLWETGSAAHSWFYPSSGNPPGFGTASFALGKLCESPAMLKYMERLQIYTQGALY